MVYLIKSEAILHTLLGSHSRYTYMYTCTDFNYTRIWCIVTSIEWWWGGGWGVWNAPDQHLYCVQMSPLIWKLPSLPDLDHASIRQN